MKFTVDYNSIWDIPRNFNILIVDDDKTVLKTIMNGIEAYFSEEFNLYGACSYHEAIEICDKVPLDLAIIDYKLQYKDGVELSKYIKSHSINTPILMITGTGDEVKEEALEAGVNVFLEKPLHHLEFLALVKNLLSINKRDIIGAKDLIHTLVRTIELRDEYTEGHSFRVANYALSIYEASGMKDAKLRKDLYIGCILHDIGKIGLPDVILKTEKSPLDPEEFEIIKKHPIEGYNICKNVDSLQDVLPVIKYHHEKLDGSGYPEGLTEKDIPEIVQISAIADIFDALTTDRSYRQKKSVGQALSIMEEEAKNHKISMKYLNILKHIIKENNNV